MTKAGDIVQSFQLYPGMYISNEAGQSITFIATAQPDILDVLRVANGLAPHKDAEPTWLLRVKPEKS